MNKKSRDLFPEKVQWGTAGPSFPSIVYECFQTIRFVEEVDSNTNPLVV